MTQRRNYSLSSLLLFLALAGCGKNKDTAIDPSADPAPKRDKPGDAAITDTPEGLKKTFEDLLAAVRSGDKDRAAKLVRNLSLPNAEAWFKKTFGDEVGARAFAEYEQNRPQWEAGLLTQLEECVRKKQTQVVATRAEGNDANGNQKRALELMKTPIALYSVRLTAPGDRAGFHLYSFVFADGTFRIVGKMAALR